MSCERDQISILKKTFWSGNPCIKSSTNRSTESKHLKAGIGYWTDALGTSFGPRKVISCDMNSFPKRIPFSDTTLYSVDITILDFSVRYWGWRSQMQCSASPREISNSSMVFKPKSKSALSAEGCLCVLKCHHILFCQWWFKKKERHMCVDISYVRKMTLYDDPRKMFWRWPLDLWL